MRVQLFFLATVASLVAGTPAFAKDDTRFTGVRVEVNSGYDSIRYDDGIAATPNTLDGVRIGGAVGYDLPIGKVMTIGIEAGGGYSISGNVSGQAGSTTYRLSGGYDLDASIRVGARVAPSTLIFAKGGYARSEFRLRTTVGSAASSTVSDAEDGWRVGAGVEQAFGDRFYAKAEYRYTNYGDDVSRHQAIIGLGYRF